jgi:spore coat protein CotH
MRIYSFLFLLLILGTNSKAQHNLPGKGEVFRDDVLPSIHITIPADSLAAILEYDNRFSDYEYHANFVFDNGTVRDSIANIGFRLRGNTSRNSAKKSFKVSFNTYESGRKYDGLEKMNINGEHNDPSITRTKLCFDMLDYLEVPASRTNHVKLFINGAYFGLYMNVEHYDEEFTQSRFNGQGNLYKCTYGADLSYNGTSPSAYRLACYELHNSNSPTAYQDLAHFIDVLNNTPSADFECELEHVFNVNSYIKCMVMDVLTGNWDGPNYNMNNFYLYFNNATGQFEYIPFDLDNTYGIDWLGKDWPIQNIYNWSKSGAKRPLYTKILARPTYAKRFTYLLDKTLKEYFNKAEYTTKFTQILGLISNAASADTMKRLDYGFTQTDFINSYTFYSKDHVKYGLQDYITRRYNSANTQLKTLASVGSLPYWHTASTDYTTDSILFTINTKGDSKVDYVLLTYNWGSQSAIWTDTLRQIGATDDYTTKIAWNITVLDLAYSFLIVTEDNTQISYPVCDMFTSTKSRTDIKLYLNELMADNTATFYDENGMYEDWIELFYDGETPLNLGEFYITDDITNTRKYRLPNVTISPNSFPLVWVDNIGEGMHASFKLGKAGETCAIFDKNGALIDQITFGLQTKDVSYGRQNDGETPWVSFLKPTPGASNNADVGIELVGQQLGFYPNPTSGMVYLVNVPNESTFKVMSMNGASLMEGYVNSALDLRGLQNGMYLLQVNTGQAVFTEKLILLK